MNITALTAWIARKIRIVAFVAGIFTCLYFVARTLFFVFAHYDGPDKFFGFLLLMGEAYILVHSFGYMMNVFTITGRTEIFPSSLPDDTSQPHVAVIVPARHEPKHVLENTLVMLVNLDYANKHIYFLDDSSEEQYKQDARELAERFHINLFSRAARHGAKAGIVNDFLKSIADGPIKYVAIFDADQNPMPDFLSKLVPVLEADEQVGFVQTPQAYTNIDASPIAKGASVQQAIFYEGICEGKSLHNAMFCAGTNVVFRKQALLDVGGFDEHSITEDFATSIKLHMRGYKSRYYNHVLAFGMAPESLAAYFKQQARWATGTINVFTRIVGYFLAGPAKLTPRQWWEYFLAGTYYFVGWAFFFLMLCPLAFLLYGVPSFSVKPEVYLAAFLPYFFLSMLVFYSTMHERHYRPGEVYRGTILGLVSFPVLMRAVLYGLAGKKMPFVITEKGGSEVMQLTSLWPWIVMIILNLAALIRGALLLTQEGGSPAIAINMFWVTYHLFILMNVFYYNNSSRRDMAAAATLIVPTSLLVSLMVL